MSELTEASELAFVMLIILGDLTLEQTLLTETTDGNGNAVDLLGLGFEMAADDMVACTEDLLDNEISADSELVALQEVPLV